MDVPFNQENETENNIELNHNYSIGLIQTTKAQLIKNYIEDTFPKVAEKLLIEGSLLAYVEPKFTKQVELECDYRLQGYPITGLAEIAYRDVIAVIAEELTPFEEKEELKQFDMDLHHFIDTETIK